MLTIGKLPPSSLDSYPPLSADSSRAAEKRFSVQTCGSARTDNLKKKTKHVIVNVKIKFNDCQLLTSFVF